MTDQREGIGCIPCSALDSALALLACGPQREADPIKWTAAAYAMTKHCKGKEDVSEAAMRIIANSREWYQRRVSMLAREQKRMRDPERTLVCDIIANGQLLPDPQGKRYGLPNATAQTPPTETQTNDQNTNEL